MIHTIFRIRRKRDGKFSTGSTSPDWTAEGRYFFNYRSLQTHLRWFLAGPHPGDYETGETIRTHGCPPPNPDEYEVVTYAVIEVVVEPLRGGQGAA